jgi:hypothetical protein
MPRRAPDLKAALMPTISQYSVAPWSKANRQLKKTLGEDETPCAICGRGVKEPWAHIGVVIDGGSRWGDETSSEKDPGFMGAWPVGTDCHRHYVLADSRHKVSVMTTEQAGLEGKGWAVICEKHNTCVVTSSKAKAVSAAKESREWCEACAAKG